MEGNYDLDPVYIADLIGYNKTNDVHLLYY